MAQRSSRSKKTRGRSSQVNKPDLRSSRKEAAAAPTGRTPRRQRTPAPAGPRLRVRPEGRGGLLGLALGAWVVAALPIVAGWLIGQWGAFSYPDSVWLYVAIGMLVASVPVGYVARAAADVDFWVLQAGLVSLGALGAEALLGPECPPNGNCGAIGARGAYGLVLSIAIVVALAIVSRWLGRWVHEWSTDRRPRSGVASMRKAFLAMTAAGLLVGVPLGMTLIATDSIVRDEPGLAREAKDLTARYCFPVGARVPDLAVRADPVGKQPGWTSLLVRRANENRPGAKGHPMPKDILNASAPTPYEAAISFNAEGDPADLGCRRLSPSAGKAEAGDYAAGGYGAEESPLDDLPSNFGSADNGGLQQPPAAAPK